jgi:transcription initiation factor TFIIIB Brf1 subunit/transcription initiation factor TFIIB
MLLTSHLRLINWRNDERKDEGDQIHSEMRLSLLPRLSRLLRLPNWMRREAAFALSGNQQLGRGRKILNCTLLAAERAHKKYTALMIWDGGGRK